MSDKDMTREPIPAKYVEVETAYYEFAHGHAPRGYGGQWSFAVAGHEDDDVADWYTNPMWFHVNNCTYAEAKKAAVKWAAANGYYTLRPLT